MLDDKTRAAFLKEKAQNSQDYDYVDFDFIEKEALYHFGEVRKDERNKYLEVMRIVRNRLKTETNQNGIIDTLEEAVMVLSESMNLVYGVPADAEFIKKLEEFIKNNKLYLKRREELNKGQK